MNYELLKDLQDAGYPQKKWCEDCGYESCDVCVKWRKEPVEPTLSELIKSFNGINLFILKWGKEEGWCAQTVVKSELMQNRFKTSPEEAVAKLWLELNK